MKIIQIIVPYEKTEAIFNFLASNLNVKYLQKLDSVDAHILIFRVPDEIVSETVEALKSRGCGVEYGFIDVIDPKISLPIDVREEAKDERISRETALAIEEIYRNIKQQATISFDFITFVILSALMAGVGLIQNNVTIIVASMLLSPLMGPMLGVALGLVVGDKALFIRGTRNELFALLISFGVGALLAALMPFLSPGLMGLVESQWTADPVILTEITRRGGFSALDVGVAIFSGAAVAISVTRGDMASLVGVAISAALMPPAVNVGMMITLGFLAGSDIGVTIGVGSLMLLVMNIVIIDIAAIVMFRIKKIGIISGKSAEWKAVAALRRGPSTYHQPNNQQIKPEVAFVRKAESKKKLSPEDSENHEPESKTGSENDEPD